MKRYIDILNKREDGVITVWLTMLLVCMLIVIIIIIEGTRYYSSKSICMQDSDIAITSAMADYEVDIYDNYHIFLLDISYGTNIKDKSMLSNKIRRYAEMSLTPNCISSQEGLHDIIGGSVNQINLSNFRYFNKDDVNLMSQVCAYMEANLRKSDISRLKSTSNNNRKKSLLCAYVLEHCSSYKSLYVLGYMKRDYVYEVEYIINGKDVDNDNLKLVRKSLDDSNVDKETRDIICSEEEYKEVLYEQLMNMDTDVLCSRLKKVIINNINNTYNKHLKQSNLLTGIDVGIEYIVKERATKIYFVDRLLDDKYKRIVIKQDCQFNY